MGTRVDRVASSLLILVLAVVATGCGIPLDDEPQVIAEGDLPSALRPPDATSSSTTTSSPEQLTESVTIYLVDPPEAEAANASLVPVVRQVPVVDTGIDIESLALEQLLLGPTEEEQLEKFLSTAVSPSGDAPILVLELRRPIDGQVVVVLSEPPAIEGAERTTAFAQMVYTVTEFNEVDQVRFMVRDQDGVDDFIAVKTDTDEGDVTRPVGRDDYSSLAPQSGFP